LTLVPLLLLAYLGFISLGLPDGLLGVGWPHMRADFGEPVGAVGFLLFVGIAGYLLSSVAAGFSIARLGVGWLLAGSTALVAAALAGYAVSPLLATVVVAALFVGFGSGAIDAGLNAYAARWFSARHMNWMHACFGLGATLGPLVMTGALAVGLGWRGGYGTVAAGQALLAVAFALTVRAWRNGRPADGTTVTRLPAARVAQTLALPAVWRGAAAFAVYVGIEVGAGLWAYTLLTEGRDLPETVAGPAVSAYWGSLFVGRVILGVVADRAGTQRVLAGSMLGIAVGAGLVALPAPGWLAVLGLMLVGLAAAPVFPLLTLTTAERVGDGHADRAIGMQVAAAGLGGTVLPAGIGVLIGRLGPEILGPSLVVLALTLAALHRRPRTPR
jgi:fucose permease